MRARSSVVGSSCWHGQLPALPGGGPTPSRRRPRSPRTVPLVIRSSATTGIRPRRSATTRLASAVSTASVRFPASMWARARTARSSATSSGCSPSSAKRRVSSSSRTARARLVPLDQDAAEEVHGAQFLARAAGAPGARSPGAGRSPPPRRGGPGRRPTRRPVRAGPGCPRSPGAASQGLAAVGEGLLVGVESGGALRRRPQGRRRPAAQLFGFRPVGRGAGSQVVAGDTPANSSSPRPSK